jgi:protein involved in polysaccharide export with SLBB domain
MKTSFIRRFVALFLCCQPVLWKSNVALAASLQPGLSVAQDDPLASPPRPALPGASDAPSRLGSSPADLDPSRGAGSASSSSGGPAVSGAGVGAGAPGAPASTTGLPPVDAAIDPNTYVCGPGDVLDLNFWGLQDFRHRTPIDLEGRAFVPRLGFFDLRGKTLSDARRLVREAVTRNYPRLSFDLVLANPRTFIVQLVDAVARPGSYPARAVDRVAALLDRTGGLAPRGSQRRIEIRRRDGTVLHPDLLLFQQTGDVKYNPYLLDGDVVRVPFEELAVTVDGAVNRPGRYELVATKDLSELLSLAGGLSPMATQLLPMSLVRRAGGDHQDQRLVDFTLAGPPPALSLANEDLLRVPSYAELQRSVVVVGAIAGATLVRSKTADAAGVAPEETSATRRMPFVQGDTVRTLLERAGGVGPLADLEGAYIQRGGKSVPVNLHALLMMRDLSADRAVELGDTVVIPFKRRNVLVEGAVFKPGEYPFNPTYGVNEYLSLAGGRNRFALELSDVRVVTPNGQTLEYKRDLRVDPGSTLVVPERNFSRAEIVQIMISIASVLVSGAAVVIAMRK